MRRREYSIPTQQTEGANCGDLPPAIVDKFFFTSMLEDRFAVKTGLAICSRCVIREQCRNEAMVSPGLPEHGVLGGVTISQIRTARKWRNYELGLSERPPIDHARPDWLPRSEAAETATQAMYELEEGIER